MPRGDGTGPAGYGPMTGRGLGYCAGYDTPGYTKGVPRGGGGFGRGFGRGFGFRNRFYNPPRFNPAYRGYAQPNPPAPAAYQPQYQGGAGAMSAENELRMLENQAQALEEELAAIRERMEELEEE